MAMKKRMPGGPRNTITSLPVLVRSVEQGLFPELWPDHLVAPDVITPAGGLTTRRTLNPAWVEWLMGFPIGWSGFER